jgi:hypothetical protein
MFLRAIITESDFFSVTTSILNPHSGAHAQIFELCACRSANVHKRAQGGPLLQGALPLLRLQGRAGLAL